MKVSMATCIAYSVPFVHFCNYYRNYYSLNLSFQLFGMFTIVHLVSYILLFVLMFVFIEALTYLVRLQYMLSDVPVHPLSMLLFIMFPRPSSP